MLCTLPFYDKGLFLPSILEGHALVVAPPYGRHDHTYRTFAHAQGSAPCFYGRFSLWGYTDLSLAVWPALPGRAKRYASP